MTHAQTDNKDDSFVTQGGQNLAVDKINHSPNVGSIYSDQDVLILLSV